MKIDNNHLVFDLLHHIFKEKTRFSVLLWANSEPPNIIQMIKFPWKTSILTAIKIIKTSLQILKGNLDLY